MTRVFALLLGVCSVSAAFAAQPLGRLFFTPGERAALDVARMQKPAPPPAAHQEPPRPTTQTITYSGIVRRNDGKSTLWLNNKPVDARDALSNLAVTGHVRPDGAVTLQVPETGASINLKVGQRAELQTGRVAEVQRDAPAAVKKENAKEDAAKGEPSKSADAKGEPARGDPAKGEPAKGKAPDEPSEKKAEAAAPPATGSRDGASHGELQERAKAR